MKRHLIFSLFVFKVISANADIAPNPIELKSIMPGTDCKVQMVSEAVYAKIYKDSSIVECTFNMKNWGKTSNIEVGFPAMKFYHWLARDPYWDDIRPFLEVYVGLKKIDKQSLYLPKAAKNIQERIVLSKRYHDSIYKAASDSLLKIYGSMNSDYQKARSQFATNHIKTDTTYKNVSPEGISFMLEKKNIPFYVWNVKFKALENVTIKVKYSVPSGMRRININTNRYFYYILSTGAGWYKNIEKATVRAHIMDFEMSEICQVNPSNYRIDQTLKDYIWDFINLEPTKNDNVYLEYFVPNVKTEVKF